MASRKIVIDPVTRIEGHLRIETRIENKRVVKAKASAEMFRGIEAGLTGYDARVAQQVTQRVCGICPYAHAEAAAIALEDAMGVKPNPNGQLLRNLIVGAYQLQDYILHFYQLCALDFIDITAVLKYRGKDNALNQLKDWVRAESKSGKIFPAAPFLPRYQVVYCDDNDINFSAIKNYTRALDVMKEIHKMVALFGGKSPHPVTIEAGGVTTTPTVASLAHYNSILEMVEQFLMDAYMPDLLAVAGKFRSYFKEGRGYANLLSYSYLPDANGSDFTFVGGFSQNGKYQHLDPQKITEDYSYGYYESKGDSTHVPLEKKQPTPLNYKDYQVEHKKTDGKYSWSKAPRYDGHAVEVGPVARVVNTYLSRENPGLNRLVDKLNRQLGIKLSDYPSVMGRHLGRLITALTLVDKLKTDVAQVEAGKLAFDDYKVPKNARGMGLTEASRGALGHWIKTDENGYILRYEMIVPTTWSISPKNADGQPGPVEQMLIGTRIKDPENPIELARIVRSTDPCMACSVH